jgi:hypothetical protein
MIEDSMTIITIIEEIISMIIIIMTKTLITEWIIGALTEILRIEMLII